MPGPAPTPSGRKRPHPRAASRDGHGAVRVGAQHGRPTGPQLRERTRCGVPVAVARADRDDREPWPDPVLETGILVCRAVVRDLEYVHRPQLRMLPQEGLLGRRFEISQQQERQTRRAHQQGHAGVVGAVRRRAGSRRPQYLPLQRPGPAPLPRPRRHHGHPGRRGGPPDGGRLPRRLLQGGGLNHTDGAAPQHPGKPSHVVGVKVRQQEEWDAAHTQGAQAGVDRPRFRSGVHDEGRPRPGGQHGGVPLAHGALDVPPVRRWPAAERTGQQRRPQHHNQQQHHQARPDPAPPPVPGPEPHDGQRDGAQQQAPAEPTGPGELRPRQPGPSPCDGGDPPGRHSRAPGEQLRRGHPQRGHGQRREAEHRGRPRRELRQQVALHRDEAHPRGEHRHHRRAHRLRRGGGPRASARRGGIPRPRRASPHRGPTVSSAPVASTESRKP